MIGELIDKLEISFTDFKKIKDENIFIKYDNEDFFDICVIIPVRGRSNFLNPLIYYFKKAERKTNLKVSYFVVEHSEFPEHSKVCKKNKINYFWIKSDKSEMFNKCLAMNVGAVYSNKSNYLIFHDLDCLVQSDFFINLYKNLENKKCKSIQNFFGRRVLYLNDVLTSKSISLDLDLDVLDEKTNGVSLPAFFGAPGGSITVDRNLFFEVGGYDEEFFLGNSPEDAFFWEKICVFTNFEISDEPKINIFHMNHPPTYYSNPFEFEMKRIYEIFKKSTIEEKKIFIEKKRKKIISYYEKLF